MNHPKGGSYAPDNSTRMNCIVLCSSQMQDRTTLPGALPPHWLPRDS